MNFLILPGQLRLALVLCWAGFSGGILYDLCTLAGRVKSVRWFADLLFGLLCWGMAAGVLGYMGEDGIRPAAVGFWCFGFCLYRLGVRRAAGYCFRFLCGRKTRPGGEQYTSERK